MPICVEACDGTTAQVRSWQPVRLYLSIFVGFEELFDEEFFEEDFVDEYLVENDIEEVVLEDFVLVDYLRTW